MNLTDFIAFQFQLLVCYIIYLILSSKKSHLQINRFYLVFAPAVIFAFVQLNGIFDDSVQSYFQVKLPEMMVKTTPVTSASSNFSWVWMLYLVGASISAILFLIQLNQILRQKTLKHLGRTGRVDAFLIENRTDSYSFFNRIFISEAQVHQAEYILKHETAHCAQKHTYDILWISILQIALWFNPVIYLWKRKMKENHEFMADRATIESESEIADYGKALLSAQLGVTIPHLGNGFNQPSLLRKRIIQLKTKNKISMKHFLLIPAFVGTALLTTSVTISEKPAANNFIVTKVLVDQEPEFPGGMDGLEKYINENIQYPKELQESGTEGKVYVSFTVTESGLVDNVKIMRGSEHEAFNQEAMRLVKGMPNWSPAVKEGKKVATDLQLPFVFAL